jgi:hydroxymethylbilane synthase
MKGLVAGSRGSKLAMTQTNQIASALDADVEIRKIVTRGDKITDVALAKVEGKAFFTRELDEALVNGEIDFAVHSFKDIPTELPDGLVIAAVPSRERPNDAIVSSFPTIEELPVGARVGTSSLRRQAQVLRARSDVQLADLRGNIDTRVRKLGEGEYDAIVVAEAGLRRLGYRDYHPLDPQVFIPAAGQGALAVTARADDEEVLRMLSVLDDPMSRLGCISERAFLAALEGGCQIPAGVHTRIDISEGTVTIIGFISTVDGRVFLVDTDEGPVSQSVGIAHALAGRLLARGGWDILNAIRDGGED